MGPISSIKPAVQAGHSVSGPINPETTAWAEWAMLAMVDTWATWRLWTEWGSWVRWGHEHYGQNGLDW